MKLGKREFQINQIKMKGLVMKKFMFLLISMQLLSAAMVHAQNITVVTPAGAAVAIAPDSIKNAVEQNFERLKLKNNLAKIFYTREAGTFILAKMSRFTYSVSFMLIKSDGKSVTVEDSNFVPHVTDFGLYSQSSKLKRSLPTTSSTGTYAFLFDTPADNIPTAVSAINTVSGYATNQQYSVDKKLGAQATLSAIENGITGDNFIAMGNIGHGNTTGILLYDGFLDYTWFGAQNLSGKVFFFNSCEVYNEPMKSAMLNSGHAKTYAGGVLDLPIGTSELVFQDFWNYTLNDGASMGAALSQAAVNHGLQNFYGIGGDVGILDASSQIAASISGPSRLSVGQQGTWTVSATGGTGSYSYAWYFRSNDTGGQWFGPVTTSSSFSSHMYDYDGYLDIRVDVTSGPRQVSATRHVTCLDCSGGPLTPQVRQDSLAIDSVSASTTGDVIIGQNYPNPFNPTTQIRFTLLKPNHVMLVVYDMLGREVARLADEHMAVGYHTVTWNASGKASGVYIYRLTAGTTVQVERMILMK